MKFKSHLLAQASGSVAGATYSHNAGGQYIRARTIPTNPQTAFQQEIRSAFGNNATSWGALSEEQREAWRQYALSVPLVDSLGDSRPISGLAMYNRCNTPRIQAGLAPVSDAPTVYNLGDTPTISSFTAEINASLFNIVASIDVGDLGFAGNVLLRVSRPLSPSIVYFKGPFRYLDKQSFIATGTRIVSVTFPYNQGTFAAGQQIVLAVRTTLADGRLSQETITRAIAAEV